MTIGTSEDFAGSSIISSEKPVVPFGPILTEWDAIGDAKFSLEVLHPLSNALSTVMQVSIPKLPLVVNGCQPLDVECFVLCA